MDDRVYPSPIKKAGIVTLTEREIPFSSDLGYSQLYRDFAEDPQPFINDFGLNSLSDAISLVSGREYNRSVIVDILARQNMNWKATPESQTNIEELKDKNSVVVAVGQQAGLFGGPYLVILKALAAIKQAEYIEKKFNVPAVPIFWIAADDHDFEEISFAEVFDRSGLLKRFTINDEKRQGYPPVGALNYDTAVEREAALLLESLPENDFLDRVKNLVDEYYCADLNIVDSFAGLLKSLLGHLGLVLFNPYDLEFKQNVSGLIQTIVEKHSDLKSALTAANTSLDKLGYHQQVIKADTATHLFYHNPNRTAIHLKDNGATAGDTRFSIDELIAEIKKDPLGFSPDVITRPLIQSAFFPVASFIGGPSEVAYYMQLGNLFKLFDIPAPAVQGRPSATIVESRLEKVFDSEGLSYNDAVLQVEQIIKSKVSESFPADVSTQLEQSKSRISDELKTLESLCDPIDPSIKDTLRRSSEKIDFQLSEIDKRFRNAHNKKNKVIRNRLQRLHDGLYPRRSSPERVITILYFISRYGTNVIDFIHRQINLEAKGHQLIMMSEYDG